MSKLSSIFVLALFTGLLLCICISIPAFRTAAIAVKTPETKFENYDIRTDKSAFETIAAYRSRSAASASQIADFRDQLVRSESSLQKTVPNLKVEYATDFPIAEVIGTDITNGHSFLTEPRSAKDGQRSPILKDFLKENASLIGLSNTDIDALKVTADYTNPNGDLSFVHLAQDINGIPVFAGELKAGITQRGEIVRVINRLVPIFSDTSVPSDFGSAIDAVRSAANDLGLEPSKLDLRTSNDPNGSSLVFGSGSSATTAEKFYFPTEPGIFVPSWRVLIWRGGVGSYVVVDGLNGTILWRKQITDEQTQSATYRVWTNSNAMINVADSPNPFSPGPLDISGIQGSRQARNTVTRIGNEPPYTFNNNGWITDGTNTTDGNAVEAGVDRENPNGVDPLGKPVPTTNRVFDFNINPGNPSGVPDFGEDPLPTGVPPGQCALANESPALIEYQKASVTQLFYTVNWYHDEMYRLGFTEQAFNFQNSNFGRGGTENDRISAEAQDCTGTGGANFSTAGDGNRGRLQMFIWTGPNPDFDGALDSQVVIHELTHGLSNRLHGNANGLTTNMARGMGEGWSDFYAQALLSDSTDPINGTYATGGYLTYQAFSGYNTNYYYGVRRFPLAVRSFTGGPNNRPHNPLTFADADQTQFNVDDGAFPRGQFGSTTADAVHNLGEIWSSALWEVRARFIARLGWEAGNRKALQLVTDGMKLSPLGPNFLNSRDAILAGASASSAAPEAAADVADVWAGFAIRGLGSGASIQNPGSGAGNTRVTESFEAPNLTQSQAITVTDPMGNNNGFPDLGETISLSIPLTNATGSTATNVSLSIAGGNSASYGTIANGATVIQTISYTVPTSTQCGTILSLTLNVNGSLGPITFVRTLTVGSPNITLTQNFDGVVAPNLPMDWPAVPVNGGINFVTTSAGPDSSPNSVFAADPATVGGGTDIYSPVVAIGSSAATVSFRHKFNTEAGWDGGVLELSIGGGFYTDIIAAGGSFIQNGYNGTLGNGTNNPLANRQAWQGLSSNYITTVVTLPPQAAGQNVQLRWRFGADTNSAPVGGGWNIDNVQIVGSYTCSVIDNFARTRADFDGDGKTDASVFRPSDGVWYLNRSTNGFVASRFGLAGDLPTPGDYDGDGKADIALWRPSDGNWYRLNSSTGSYVVQHFGSNGDIPQSGDFDGDTKHDIAVWRPNTGTWYWLSSNNGQVTTTNFGLSSDLPVADDYDGDLRDDIAVWRPSNGVWYRLNSSNGQFVANAFGSNGDKPTNGDYDGDGRADLAIYRPSEGNWYRLNSGNAAYSVVRFGISTDVPVPGDYDGDGKMDQAVYRDGVWYLDRSTSGFLAFNFGIAGDVPIPNKYLP